MTVPKWTITRREDPDSNTLFDVELENNPLVLFHVSQAHNLTSILDGGFRSAVDLGTGPLPFVSYSKSSNQWSIYAKYPANGDWVIFAVRFDTLDLPGIRVNHADVFVQPAIQPAILGYCEIPNGYPHKQNANVEIGQEHGGSLGV